MSCFAHLHFVRNFFLFSVCLCLVHFSAKHALNITSWCTRFCAAILQCVTLAAGLSDFFIGQPIDRSVRAFYSVNAGVNFSAS